jgi:DNA-binding response OmpR family regulator
MYMHKSFDTTMNTHPPLDKPRDRRRAPGSRPLVLIVEEHEETRSLLRTIMMMKKCSVMEVEIEDVFSLAEGTAPSLMLINIGRPFRDGLETIKHLREHKSFQNIPIIVTSGNATATFRNEVSAAGYDRLLVKPIDIDELDGLLDDYLS